MEDAVIRVTSRIYHKGEPRERYINRARIAEEYWFDYADRVEWAVLILSGVKDYATASKFTAWRPSMPDTDGSDRSLHYVATYPYQLDWKALEFDIIEPDADRSNVWIGRAWLESGFTAADRRRIYAALKQITVARHWHDFQPVNREHGKLHVLETGNLPGW
jgi:hypothetical protein